MGLGKRTWTSPKDYGVLRQSFDSNDKFMNKPQVKAVRLGNRTIPTGLALEGEVDANKRVLDRDKVIALIKRKFPRAGAHDPKCDCRPCQKAYGPNRFMSRADCPFNCRECRETLSAQKWWDVIFDAFHERATSGQIEARYGWVRGTVSSTLQQITRFLNGQRLDGKPRTGRRRGRPKKTESVEGISPAPPVLITNRNNFDVDKQALNDQAA